MTHEPASRHPVEPLAESAPIAWAAAPRLCAGDPSAFDCCRWYHQVWQYLRLLGLITSIRVNADFLVATFRDLARDGGYPAVLISGSADYGMLAHLRHAYADRPLDVTVLDLCDTPLLLNRWYADRHGMTLAARRRDVLEPATDGLFDAVCTHNFLGRFHPDPRRRVVARWHALLRPGGVVVTTQRVEPRLAPESRQEADDRARALRARVAAAVASRTWPGPDADALGEAAYEGWRRRADSYRVRSTREVTDAFEAEGFDLLRVDEGGGPAERFRDRGTPVFSTDSYRMRLVARRR
jgi:SAM-dependent methyltransferase